MGMSQDDILRDRLPETVPSDAPQPKKPETPAAPAGEPKLYAGKYKTVEEMERAYTEAQTALNRESEARQRAESLLLTPTPTGEIPAAPFGVPVGSIPGEGLDQSEFVTRGDAVRLADERFQARIREYEQSQDQQRRLTAEQQYWRDEFYRRHPDLKDDDPLVKGFTGDVIQRYAHLDPQRFRTAIPIILDEVAGKVRTHLAAKKTAWKTEAERAAAAQTEGQIPGSGGPVAPPASSQAPSTDDLRAEAERESFERYQRGRQPLKR